MTKNPRSWFCRYWRLLYQRINGPVSFIATVLGLATVYFTAVEWRVRSIVGEPAFIEEVASRVRPSLVFDSKGRVLADTGAMAFLEEVPRVSLPSAGDKTFIAKIIVSPKRYISEPVVEALDFSFVAVDARRSNGLSWEIVVTERTQLMTTFWEPPSNAPSPRFRLELVVR